MKTNNQGAHTKTNMNDKSDKSIKKIWTAYIWSRHTREYGGRQKKRSMWYSLSHKSKLERPTEQTSEKQCVCANDITHPPSCDKRQWLKQLNCEQRQRERKHAHTQQNVKSEKYFRQQLFGCTKHVVDRYIVAEFGFQLFFFSPVTLF